ncbi:phenylalanine--tRNA ligase beta subunit [Arthrobacter sp. Hiyo4]|nr:phenylalanine--tRNA ligase beta subunit [Arthrobacter sp. Hiyo4]
MARTVRGVDATRPTPPWMTSRLRLAGIRSISLPVDISNYVMLELGQPTHCYDLDKLSGDIVVRRAVAGRRSPPWTTRSARSTSRTSSSPTVPARSALPA